MSSNKGQKTGTSESLSQDEIDLLFSAGGEEESDSPPESGGPEVQVYDFRRPARISKDRKRSLEAIYGLLAKAVEGWLAGRVRDSLVLELQSVEELTFGEFMLALPSPCASFILEIGDTAGQQGVIDFGHEFAYFIVDRLLGGMSPPILMERALTPTERLVVRIVAERVVIQLAEVWQDYVKMDLSISGFETMPEMLQVANREDPVLAANLNVSMGDLNSPLLICLPFSVLEKFFTSTGNRKVQSAQGSEAERAEERKHLEGSLRNARIPVQARFKESYVTLKELAALKEGSVLETNLATDSELMVYVAGQKRFAGVPGRMGQNLAARLERTLKPEPEDLIEPSRNRE
jgi:flagellar motor switch protein FliM